MIEVPARFCELIMTPVQHLRNIGPKSTAWLNEIGIYTAADLERVGVVNAYRECAARFRNANNLNLLWALQAALLDIPWNALPDEMKQALLDELHNAT